MKMERIAEQSLDEAHSPRPSTPPFLKQQPYQQSNMQHHSYYPQQHQQQNVYLGQPRPSQEPSRMSTAKQQQGFPPNHPLANMAIPMSPSSRTLYQQQQSRLHYYHTRPPVYVQKPSFGLTDFDLLDTLGKVYATATSKTNRPFID